MTFTAEQNTALAAPLDPKHVRKPSGSFGPKGDYLEGWHVINELNRVFGFDGWSYTVDLNRDALSEGKDSKGNVQWQAAYTCICTLTVGDVKRQDVGFGSGFAKQVGDAIEGATKEATTDALKRCARTFGNVFGLALYDKSRANVQAPPAELSDDTVRMLDAIEGAQTLQSLYEWKALRSTDVNASPDKREIVRAFGIREQQLKKEAA